MDKYLEITNLLQNNHIAFREHGSEIITHCLFSECDTDSRGNEAHLYINRSNGAYFCQKCGAKGNLVTLRKHFGVEKPQTERKAPRTSTLAAKYQAALPDSIRDYLRTERLLNDDVISDAQIGYVNEKGKRWISLPVVDRAGNVLFMKLRQDPFNFVDGQAKYMSTGGEAYMYNAQILNKQPDMLVICEGEFDCLVLKRYGIPAICSTAGAATFKDDWISQLDFVREFYVVMDNDDAGRKGADGLIKKLAAHHPSSSVLKITLPPEVGDHGDVTDFFRNNPDGSEDLFKPDGKYVTLAAGLEPINVKELHEITLDDVANTLSLTIKHDYENKVLTFLCMLSAYTEESQLNVSFNAPSSSGKTFITTEIAKLFPAADKIELSGASPTSFYHGEGVYDKEREAKIVSLERKILLLYEQPNPALQEKLRAVLSHDQKELQYRITNKDKKGSQRAELIIIRGFPATIFCSAGLQLDEQEATRAILLSPETNEAKLKDGVTMQAFRGSNTADFDTKLESQPERIALKNRILAIKREHIDEIIIEDPNDIVARFNKMFGRVKPRHMRDMGHIIRLIKVIALLNVWHRRRPDGMIIANEYDIDHAFMLWAKVTESQDLNVPPVVMQFYKEYILPAYAAKSNDHKYEYDVMRGSVGLSSQELSAFYLGVTEVMLNDENLRKQILPQLLNAGMIALEQPDFGDRRSKHIFPKYFPDGKDKFLRGNNIGTRGGDSISDDEWSEIMRMF